ncbi:ORF75 [Retroperitoneal fibromatosis-associated herpesvirus]|uniref:ORF75 n=1 Tax=Retroperitoneal fibromatosis-associated herpesvirus TaxID=111469 RepID=U5NM95_9GAMA|nr:ORF75 [Retroperitoneal fibromatosis-associated herpesvirus]AGY30763.1 ORF75 [Retroperitoneal fibromatosis-associated herpesvirus]
MARSVQGFWLPGDLTPDEEAFVAFYTGRQGHLTLIAGGTRGFNLLWLIYPSPAVSSAERERREAEMQLTLALMGPHFDYPQSSRRSAPEGGPHLVSFGYGPDLRRRPTTVSMELTAVLAELGMTSLQRLEIGRHLLSRIVQTLMTPIPEHFIQAFTAHTEMVPYRGLEPIGSPPDDAPPQQAQDVIRDALMLPLAPDLLSLAVQASTGDNYNLARYFVVANSCTVDMWGWHCSRHAFEPLEAYTHVHSSFHLGLRDLSDLLFHGTLFPGGHTQAALTGLYATNPALGPRAQGRRRRIVARGLNHASLLHGAGVPTLGGFLKTVDTVPSALGNVMAVCSITTTTAKDDIVLRRMRQNQHVICFGRFDPTTTPDSYPGLYTDSADNVTRALQTVHLVHQLAEGPVFSSLNRSHDPGIVEVQLRAVVARMGLLLFLSRLPGEVRDHLPTDPPASPETIQDTVSRYFLQVYSSLLFAVVAESWGPEVSRNDTPLDVVMRAARLCGCPVSILGITTEQQGIRIVDDLPREGDTSELQLIVSMDELPSTSQSAWLSTSSDHLGVVIADTVDWSLFNISSIVHQMLRCPTVGSKEMFTRHMDRCSNGLIAQQAGIGPLDLPLSDYHLVLHSAMLAERVAPAQAGIVEVLSPDEARRVQRDVEGWVKTLPTTPVIQPAWRGQAMALGEQAYKMAINVISGATYAIAEAITNIMFSPVSKLQDIVLAAAVTWSSESSQAQALQQCIFTCKEFCRDLGVGLSFTSGSTSLPLSERMLQITQRQETVEVVQFNSIVFTSSAEVKASRYRVTPDLKRQGNALVYLPVSQHCTVEGSTFEHLFLACRNPVPPLNSAKIASLFYLIKFLMSNRLVVSGHDIGDGGLLVAAIEMAMAGCRGLALSIPDHPNPLEILVSETPGALVEVPQEKLALVLAAARDYSCIAHVIGEVGHEGQAQSVTVSQNDACIFQETLSSLLVSWTAFADETWAITAPPMDPGEEMHRKDHGMLEHHLGGLQELCMQNRLRIFACPRAPRRVASLVIPGSSPPYALMSAFQNVGFEVACVTVEELKSGLSLNGFSGLITSQTTGCQASYVSARAWAAALANNPTSVGTLAAFFGRLDTFSVCCGEVGFQLLTALGVIARQETMYNTFGPLPPHRWLVNLEPNVSGTYDSHWLNVHIPQNTRSIFLRVLRGTVLPCWAQGRFLGVRYERDALEYIFRERGNIAMAYHSQSADENHYARHYPRNPTAHSTVAGLTSNNGRHTALLVDPALTFHPWQWQYIPRDLTPMTTSPWALAFQAMYVWCVRRVQLHDPL